MSDSILTTVKQVLGITEDYEVFDTDIILHINTAFGTLNQLGIGPDEGFQILDKSAEWSEFLDTEIRYNPVKSYIYLRVRLLFDPPSAAYVLTSFEKQLDELTWRINTSREDIVHSSVVVISP